MTPRAIVLQHVAPEGPGLIARALQQAGLGLHVVRVDQGERVPGSVAGAAALVVMGGPMGVYQTDRYQHLRDELRLIQSALQHDTPVLGICLGSQLLAAALGARVFPGPRKEIGWYDVTLTSAAAHDPLWRDLPSPFPAFHWHGDVFELPAHAEPLAASALTPLQGFRFGEAHYGLLFHLEVDRRQIEEMARRFAGELAVEELAPQELVNGANENLGTTERIGTMVFSRWAAMVAARAQGMRGEG